MSGLLLGAFLGLPHPGLSRPAACIPCFMVVTGRYLCMCVYVCALQGGMGRIQSNLASRVKKGRMSEAAAQAAMARVKVGQGSQP